WQGPPELFDRLDRDSDGVIASDDFDWSMSSAFVRQWAIGQQAFGAFDPDSNGRISPEEWEAIFKKAAGKKGYLTADDMGRMLFPRPPKRKTAEEKAKEKEQEKQFIQVVLKGLFQNELGSPFEGPRVGEPAPDFTLPTADHTEKLTFSEYRGKKPA